MAAEAADQLLGASLRSAVTTTGAISEDELLLRAEEALEEGRDPEAAALEQVDAGTLGVLDVVSAWVGRIPKPEGLRRALEDWLEDDRTFDVQFEDELFAAMAERVGGEIDFVVTGHTHKPRALSFPSGTRYYNSGTWIRTLRLTSEALADRARFENDVWPVLRDGRMDDLDAAMIPGPGGQSVPLVLDRTNAVQISAKNGSAVGRLVRVSDNPSDDGVVLRLEPRTKPHEVKR